MRKLRITPTIATLRGLLIDTSNSRYYTYFGSGVGLAFPKAAASSPFISGLGVTYTFCRNN